MFNKLINNYDQSINAHIHVDKIYPNELLIIEIRKQIHKPSNLKNGQ